MADIGDREPTRVVPTVASDADGFDGGPPDGPPGAPDPDRRWWWVAGLAGVVVAVAIALLIASGDDGDNLSADNTTTTSASTSTSSSSTSSTSSTTSTTAATTSSTAGATTSGTEGTTTSATTPPTVAPALCDPTSFDEDEVEQAVQVVYLAFTVGDRTCASQLMTASAEDDLFAIPGNGAGWEFQGCNPPDLPDTEDDCAYTFNTGATHFLMAYSAIQGWQVTEVFQTTD